LFVEPIITAEIKLAGRIKEIIQISGLDIISEKCIFKKMRTHN
jgi:hypothetical protein